MVYDTGSSSMDYSNRMTGLYGIFLDTPPTAIEPFSYTYLGMKQLMAGGGIILLGTTLIPLLSVLF